MNVNGYKSKAAALRAINDTLEAHGYNTVAGLLAEPKSNPKVAKNGKLGVLTAPMHLAPAKLSGFNLCASASPGCIAACLHTAGNPAHMPQKTTSRIAKSQAYMRARKAFMAVLTFEIAKHQRDAKAADMMCGVRLNATSDIPWEAVGVEIDGVKHRNLMEAFGGIQFYDYTKITKRAVKSVSDPRWPFNYHLTFSKAEDNDNAVADVLRAGGNVAAVFATKHMPDHWQGVPVINGDAHDFRPADGVGVVVGLKAKGEAKADTSGFVVR